MTSMISALYTGLCGLVVIGFVRKMFRSDDIYEQIVCGVVMAPFLLRALHIR
ncbi:MAG: hypothetical protein NUW23_14295 [Firmicutes bacterium]|jgi:hypothetical protein|nr:hypothetical protein [Bacillota bacterium]